MTPETDGTKASKPRCATNGDFATDRSVGYREPGGGVRGQQAAVAGPRHRRPAALTATGRLAGTFPHRVLQGRLGQVLDFGKTELLALVDVRAAGQGQHEHRRGARPAGAELQVDGLLDVALR